MTAFLVVLAAGASLTALGLWLDRRWTPAPDPLVARLTDDDEWARLLAAVEGDWAAWEWEVAS